MWGQPLSTLRLHSLNPLLPKCLNSTHPPTPWQGPGRERQWGSQTRPPLQEAELPPAATKAWEVVMGATLGTSRSDDRVTQPCSLKRP